MKEYEYEFARFLYYTPGPLDREGGMWPVRAGRSRAKPQYKVGPKRIECFSLHFVLEGKARFEFGGRSVELQKNDLFCLFPGRTYHYSAIRSDPSLQLCWLALDGERVKPLLELAGVTPERPYRKEAVTPRAWKSVDRTLQVLEGAERWSPVVSLELQSGIYGMFAALIPDTATSASEEPAGWIRECLDYMELHATEGISVQQVAEFAGVHRSYFASAFAGQVGMPPQKYIQKVRMDKAKRLIQETDATVTEIAYSLGYPNLYSFTRAFKGYYQVSPMAMRTAGKK
ncbi:AraC family transcriptional regulator [Cohnella caldifontis]|uniref:AraC family transcriptional regulator n=1 Tax=Cohnella caldifontis TaxID=3027471 RepID=UPI0023EAEAA2|nr:AraC family transcriptional regulator [Cohnella sp. YIM B05605]